MDIKWKKCKRKCIGYHEKWEEKKKEKGNESDGELGRGHVEKWNLKRKFNLWVAMVEGHKRDLKWSW